MPYHITRRGSQFCVLKDENDEKMGCHPTHAEAQKQLAALNIAMKKEKATSEEWEQAMTWIEDSGWRLKLGKS